MTDSVARVVDGRAGVLAAGSIVNGVAGFVLMGVGLRTYGAEGFASVSVVWSIWSLSAAVLTFPVQHWTIRELARGTSRDVIASTHARALVIATVAGVGLGVGAALAGPSLLRTDSIASPLAIAALTVLAVPVGWTRGRLVGEGRYVAAASAVGGENVIRLVAGCVVALSLPVDWFTLSLVLGSLVIFFWPREQVLRSPRRSASLANVAQLSVANSVAQVTLVGAPLVLAALGGSNVLVSATFATMTIARAPYLVLLSASMRFTAGWSDPDQRAPRRQVVGALALAAAGVVAGASVLVGPWFIGVLFGQDARLSGAATAVVAAGAVLALGTLVQASLYTAQDDTSSLVRGWIVAALLGSVGLLAPVPLLWRTMTWFLATEIAAILILSYWRWPGTRTVMRRRTTT